MASRSCALWPGAILIAVCILWVGVDWARGQGGAGRGPFDWMGYDAFDEITDRMDAITPDNCRSKPASDLRLPQETLAQMPYFNKLLSTIIYPNRTDLLHLHNMALNRAFFYSYIMQKLNETENWHNQPGLMYYYFSSAADISANEYNINGSAVFYDYNCSYANWYRNLGFNETLPLFGPRAWRFDDYNDPTNWLREPTNNTIDVIDYGSGPQNNYTVKSYKINQWYDLWLPDDWDKAGFDSVRKHSYDIGIKYSNETGRFTTDEWVGKVFFGPPSPGQKESEHLPVVYTEPYYDCGRSNKWIVSAVSPIVDQLPRYLDWFHLRRYKFVAVIAMDMDFFSIDLNPCPFGIGNERPNYFAETARCKPSTMCEPLYGWGFRRGGYHCVCKPGYRYPPWQRGPFLGIQIESATEEEFQDGFDCIPVELRQVLPIIRGNDTIGTPTNLRSKRAPAREEFNYVKRENQRPDFVRRTDRAARTTFSNRQSRILNQQRRFLRMIGLKEVDEVTNNNNRVKRRIVAPIDPVEKTDHRQSRYAPRYKRDTAKIRRKRSAFDQEAYNRMQQIIKHKESINAGTCENFKPDELELPGDVSFGVEKKFTYQARTALRLAHFLSNFLQNIDMYEEYGNLRGDQLLNIEQLFGEVLSNVMGDLKIKGSGIFYDIDKYIGPDSRTRQFFGPYAYRYQPEDSGGPEGDQANTHFRAVDYAGFETHYLDRPWFKNVKERWQSNTYGLTKFTEKTMIRSDLAGTSLKKFEMYPMYYRAPKEEDGWWSAPYFDCGNEEHVNDWIITYAVPFFGLNSIGSALEFKGTVVVDVKLDELDINQCPMDFHVANAFANTARCHFETTFCEALPGKKFERGSYKCECLQGWEYPFNDKAWYFDGQSMEEEYDKMIRGEASRYETLKCRISGASSVVYSWMMVIPVLLALWKTGV